MIKKIGIYLMLMILIQGSCLANGEQQTYDICIYGGTSAGVIAAYTAAKAGKSVVLIEPGQMLGGMSSGGLGQTDIGNKYVVRGLGPDFYRKIGKHYGTFEHWIFEPKVAEAIFNQYMEQCDADVHYGQTLLDVTKTGREIREIRLQSVGDLGNPSLTIRAKVFMDCSYEGDLMAAAGASYHVGREDNSLYGETLNGVQLLDGHQFPDDIDPYVVLAIDQDIAVQEVDIAEIKDILATNPKADHRQPDVLISSTDTDAMQFTGKWEKGGSKGYGRTYAEANSKAGISTAKFVAASLQSGSYDIYTYFPRLPKARHSLLIPFTTAKRPTKSSSICQTWK